MNKSSTGMQQRQAYLPSVEILQSRGKAYLFFKERTRIWICIEKGIIAEMSFRIHIPASSLLVVLVLTLLMLPGCTGTQNKTIASPIPLPTRVGTLKRYQPSAIPPSTTLAVPTEPPAIPSATPTPRTHVVQKGEDMLGIALRYRISLEDLKSANPDVNPNILSIGTALVIPGASTPVATASSPDAPLPSPTPVPLKIGRMNCTATQEGGAWCFLPVTNQQPAALEGLTAVFRMADDQQKNITAKRAFLPLDRLLPGETLPLVAYFSPPVPRPFEVSAEILTALPSPEDGRYNPTLLNKSRLSLLRINWRSGSRWI